MKRVLLFIAIALSMVSNAQDTPLVSFTEATLAAGSYRGTFTATYFYNWRFGKNDRLAVGTGARFTSFLGSNLYYITAPAALTSGSTGPLVLFKENISENIDSFLIKSPQVNSLNIAINIEYRFGNNLTGGFNIDALGFSFGKKTRANYINGDQGKITNASPTAFNILLVSDNDRGSLNSEFYARYFLNQKIALKGAAQFLFTEYTAETEVQEEPQKNDRFRNKALLLAIGISYKL